MLHLIRLVRGWVFPYINLTYSLYKWGFLHFTYLKCLVGEWRSVGFSVGFAYCRASWWSRFLKIPEPWERIPYYMLNCAKLNASKCQLIIGGCSSKTSDHDESITRTGTTTGCHTGHPSPLKVLARILNPKHHFNQNVATPPNKNT